MVRIIIVQIHGQGVLTRFLLHFPQTLSNMRNRLPLPERKSMRIKHCLPRVFYCTLSTTFDAVQCLPKVFDNVNHKNLAVYEGVLFSGDCTKAYARIELSTNQRHNGFLT